MPKYFLSGTKYAAFERMMMETPHYRPPARKSRSRERKLINPAHFCQNCRTLLVGIELEGYIILDHCDLNHVRAYPVRKNSNQVIRDYRVTVDKGKGGTWALCVTGLQKE